MSDDKKGCCCGGDKRMEHHHDWEACLKEMSKEDLMMKKEKLEKKLTMVNKLLKEKK